MGASETAANYVLESLRPRYEAEGYHLFPYPSPSILPPFMAGHRPDAIAIGPQKKIAFQVAPARDPEKAKKLSKLIGEHGDWELHVVTVPKSLPTIDVASRAAIDRAIATVRDLKNGGHAVPALIMGWAVVEAIGRALEPDRYSRPQTPGRLLEFLAHEGYLDVDDAALVRPLIPLQNTVVHGALDAAVSEQTSINSSRFLRGSRHTSSDGTGPLSAAWVERREIRGRWRGPAGGLAFAALNPGYTAKAQEFAPKCPHNRWTQAFVSAKGPVSGSKRGLLRPAEPRPLASDQLVI